MADRPQIRLVKDAEPLRLGPEFSEVQLQQLREVAAGAPVSDALAWQLRLRPPGMPGLNPPGSCDLVIGGVTLRKAEPPKAVLAPKWQGKAAHSGKGTPSGKGKGGKGKGKGSGKGEAPSHFRAEVAHLWPCLLYTSPSPRDKRQSRMPSSA